MLMARRVGSSSDVMWHEHADGIPPGHMCEVQQVAQHC